MRRLGILGGTFDPIHIGHLVMASYGIEAIGLDQVWLMPAQTPPHKQREITPVELRFEMCKLATRLDFRLEVSDLDIRGDTPSYTSELLALLHELHPAADLTFLVGTDSLASFTSWHEPERILQLARLGVAERPGSAVPDEALDAMPGLRDRVIAFDSPLIELSSTEIRKRRRLGQSITWLVPESVEEFIIENDLYRNKPE